MSRKVKCFVTGEEGTNETFVKIGTHYYKSQEIYEQYRHEVDTRNAIVTMIANNFLGYQSGQKFPAYIQKKLKEFDFYSNDVILATLEKMSDTIQYYMNNKDFKSESGKISYIFAILSNNINDINKQFKHNKKVEKEHKTEIMTLSEIDISRPAPKGRDISDWLDEEDL